MGLFSKGGETSGKPSGTTIIAEGTRFFGELTLEGKLHIDGTLEGTIDSEGDVSVGQTGYFEGSIRANHLLVSGHVQGKVECDFLEIVSTGRLYGEVASQNFVIEPGGQFVGESLTRDKQPVAALSYRKAESTAEESATAATDADGPQPVEEPSGKLGKQAADVS